MQVKCSYKKLIPPEQLVLHDKNSNKHPEKQIDLLAKLLKYQGFRVPIIVSNLSGMIVSGNGRREAAIKAGFTEVPVDFQDFENKAQEMAFLESDNLVADLAQHDTNAMIENIKELDLDEDFDLEMFGVLDFELPEIKMLDDENEDTVPENVDTRCKEGDLWLLGEHRLLCGDSTNVQHVEKLMDGEKADMVFTDIPYNISQKSNGLRELDYGEWDKGAHDIGIKTMFITEYADSFYYFCGDEQLSEILIAFKEYGFSTRSFVWHKTNPTVMNGDKLWLPSQELCAYAKKPKAIFNEKCKHAFYEGAPNSNRVHPNQKPIELVQKCIEASSNKSVIDIFGGSGSTLIACEKTNRKCFMMELDPHYCDVILTRWEQYTGKTAERVIQ